MARPIGIDIFCGAGGMSLGFERAGFDIVAAVEIDPVHACTHKFNFPKCATLARSVIGLTAEEIRETAGIGDTPVDVVFGGAPCQGFSLIGQRAIDDPRNLLVREFVRIVRDLNAKYFVFENVKGLTVGKHLQFLNDIIDEFSTSGYAVRKQWKVLNAGNYGVPQNRERLFLIGSIEGQPLPNYPPKIPNSVIGNEEKPTCRDALSDLPDIESLDELTRSDEVLVSNWDELSKYAQKMRCLDNDAFAYGYPRNWNRKVLTSSMRTNHSEISRRRFAETIPGEVEPISRYFKLPPDGVSNTLRAGTDSSRGAFTSPRPIHYLHPRCITVREMARLHSFPDWFRFHVTKWHGARQIGNAVPPLLAEVVAAGIIEALGIGPEKPLCGIPLGDPELLKLNMTKAAKYWGVQKPIGQRDKKSGARKRSQQQIEVELLAANEAKTVNG